MTRPTLLLTDGFWCECWTRDPATDEARNLLGSLDVESAPQAIRWIRVAARTVAPALNLEAFAEAWAWLSDDHHDALQALTKGKPCTLVIHDCRTTIEWTVHPVRYLKLASRQAINLPGVCGGGVRPASRRLTPFPPT